jgi:hypothetical protein
MGRRTQGSFDSALLRFAHSAPLRMTDLGRMLNHVRGDQGSWFPPLRTKRARMGHPPPNELSAENRVHWESSLRRYCLGKERRAPSTPRCFASLAALRVEGAGARANARTKLLSSQSAVRHCTARTKPCGLRWTIDVVVAWNEKAGRESSGFEARLAAVGTPRRESARRPCYRSELGCVPGLAKGERRFRIQQPSPTVCIFLPV